MQPADPYAQQRALEEWAQSRGYTLRASPDIRAYQAWAPFTFISHFSKVGRELGAEHGDVAISIIETFEGDPLKQATGEDRHVMAFVLSAQLKYRAAVRAKKGAGELTDIGRSIGALFGSAAQPGSILGDPAFEQHFEVKVPSRDEGIHALPGALRQLLLGASFRGALETRPGGMIMQFYAHKSFDPARLDELTNLLGQAYQAAIGS